MKKANVKTTYLLKVTDNQDGTWTLVTADRWKPNGKGYTLVTANRRLVLKLLKGVGGLG